MFHSFHPINQIKIQHLPSLLTCRPWFSNNNKAFIMVFCVVSRKKNKNKSTTTMYLINYNKTCHDLELGRVGDTTPYGKLKK